MWWPKRRLRRGGAAVERVPHMVNGSVGRRASPSTVPAIRNRRRLAARWSDSLWRWTEAAVGRHRHPPWARRRVRRRLQLDGGPRSGNRRRSAPAASASASRPAGRRAETGPALFRRLPRPREPPPDRGTWEWFTAPVGCDRGARLVGIGIPIAAAVQGNVAGVVRQRGGLGGGVPTLPLREGPWRTGNTIRDPALGPMSLKPVLGPEMNASRGAAAFRVISQRKSSRPFSAGAIPCLRC